MDLFVAGLSLEARPICVTVATWVVNVPSMTADTTASNVIPARTNVHFLASTGIATRVLVVRMAMFVPISNKALHITGCVLKDPRARHASTTQHASNICTQWKTFGIQTVKTIST